MLAKDSIIAISYLFQPKVKIQLRITYGISKSYIFLWKLENWQVKADGNPEMRNFLKESCWNIDCATTISIRDTKWITFYI